jgi:signal transduction histidine kinase/ActR/RegA family two-component response regulator
LGASVRRLFEIHPSIQDAEMRRQSRLLAASIAVITPIFVCVDTTLFLSTRAHHPPWIGYLFLIGTFALNHTGRYRLAAALAVAMFPLVAFGQVFLRTSTLPLVTLGYVALGPLFGAIFLSIRGVIALTVLNIVGIALASRLVPEIAAEGVRVIGVLSTNAMIGLLASFYMHHRNGVEADRRSALLAQVAERERLEDRLRQSQKMESLGQFAGGIAHDFNNVLMVIRGNVGLLSRHQPSKELQLIESAVSSAAALTRQLLAFGRRAVIEPTVLDVGQVVHEALAMVRRIIGESIAIEHDVPDAPLHARLDRAQLEQVILNLATNARDAMPGGGTLSVSAMEVDLARGGDGLPADFAGSLPPDAAPGAYVCLSVRDDGQGMDEATQQRAFEPFFTTKARGHGTGLGLATVFGIVSQSGGFIRVSSQPGRGTRFDLFFPRSTEAITAVLESDRPAPARGAECVLVVEDDDGVRAIVALILSEGGYEAVSVSSLREARATWRQQGPRFALVITDMVLSDGHGLDFARQLRGEHPELPILCMSGYAEREGYEAGQDGFAHLQKPFAADELLGRVRGVIDRTDGQRKAQRRISRP